MNNKRETDRKKEKQLREAVVMLIRNGKDEVLFAKRSMTRKFLSGVWSLPSGHMEVGEDISTTVIREGKEELNIDIHNVTFVETINEPSGDNTKIHLVDVPVSAYTGDPVANNDEFERIEWMSLENFFTQFRDEEIGSTLKYLRPKFQSDR